MKKNNLCPWCDSVINPYMHNVDPETGLRYCTHGCLIMHRRCEKP